MRGISVTHKDAAQPSRSIEDDQTGAFPRRQELGLPPNNLPLQLTSFVGRGREMAQTRALLESNRLLTLTGPGGSGKTRLALAVASGMEEDFEDGVWLVELAALSDPDLVPKALASVLGVRVTPGTPLVDSLCAYLQSRQTLLVMDNCEHLVRACAELAETLLRSCPNLNILATSREMLGVPGETLFAVHSLSLPDPHRSPSPGDRPSDEATELFVERARAVRPGFALGEGNAMAVAHVCYRLDGIPLAIELAAARMRVLSVEQISSRLDESFRLLAAGSRGNMPHHRTLRATMDWSYDLLSRKEQILFRRLSVFAGGWTLEAAEEVSAGDDLEQDEVLDLLSRLVDKSLVFLTERDREARYRLLETIRQYGWEKLEDSGEADKVRGRHAAWFFALAERAEPGLKGSQQLAWLERLEREHDNLRAAMRWPLDRGEVQTAVRLIWALRLFWYVHGHQGEGYRYTREALHKAEVLSTRMRARALCAGGLMSYGLESVERTRRLWEEGAALFRQAGDKFGLAVSLAGMGLAALQQGDMGRARVLFEEALELYREIGDKWGVSSILSHLGIIPLTQGDHERAVRYFEDALAISREIGDRLIGSIALYNLALGESQVQGDHERAAELYVEGLRLAVEMGDKANAAYCLEGLGNLISERGGEPEHAARLFGASETLLEAVGAPRYVQAQARLPYEHAVEALRSRLGETAFAAAWAEGRTMSPEQAVEYDLGPPPTAPGEPSPPPTYPADLSAREVEVLRLVARGLTNAQVAQELYISPRTVNAHVGSIYHKIGYSTRAEAARFATEHDLL